MAGIIKLDRLNQVWHMQNSPGPRPRLYGAIEDKSPVPKMIQECTKLDLTELVENPNKRRQVIMSQIPIMFSRDDEDRYVSETGSSSVRPRSALRVPLPAASPLTQTGGLLQLQRLPLSLSPMVRNYGRGNDGHDGRRQDGSWPGSANRPGSIDIELPAAPRKAGLLRSHELLSTQEIRDRDMTPVFASDQTSNGKYVNLCLNAVGCDRPNCIFCKRSLVALQSADPADTTAALRRAIAVGRPSRHHGGAAACYWSGERESTPGHARSRRRAARALGPERPLGECWPR